MLTDEELTDAALEQVTFDNSRRCIGRSFTHSATVLRMATELRSRRQRDLTSEDKEALRWLKTQAYAIQHERIRAGSDCFPNPTRALAVLSKLLGGEP